MGIKELDLQYITFLFLLKSLSSLSPISFSEVFLHSDFKFRQICHRLLKRSVDLKTRFSPVREHTIPFTPTCLAMFLSFAHVLLNENVALPFLANL